jgi:hypothetical protein
VTGPEITFGEITDEALEILADLILDELEAEAAAGHQHPQEPAA